MARVYENKIPIYPIFYLLKGDYSTGSGGSRAARVPLSQLLSSLNDPRLSFNCIEGRLQRSSSSAPAYSRMRVRSYRHVLSFKVPKP